MKVESKKVKYLQERKNKPEEKVASVVKGGKKLMQKGGGLPTSTYCTYTPGCIFIFYFCSGLPLQSGEACSFQASMKVAWTGLVDACTRA
jgi:hypothetical protein